MICNISVKDGYFYAERGEFYLCHKVSDKLKKLIEVKEYDDNGYIVIDCEYEGIGVVEEYFDLQAVLHDLQQPTKILKSIRGYKIWQ